MTTKFYEADRDLAFSKYYCPQTDYLDVYSSSCRSSTQTSTVSDWSEDDISLQLSLVGSANIRNTTACLETGSVECIDVAMENQGEVYRGGAKTVPKRQIQLKRRDAAESQDSDKGEVTDEGRCTPCTVSHRRDVLMRQHSTPAAFHRESHGTESVNRTTRAERKQRLQKSVSLDETSTKTKMASCIIKSVLSKKMQLELNLQNSEVKEGAFAPAEVQNNVKNCHQSPLAVKGNNTTDMSSVDSHRQSNSIQYHQVASAKTHQKLLYKQNSIPLVSSFGGSEFQRTFTKRAGIATALESVEIEWQNPWNGALPYANRSPGDRLSCDSAKGKNRSTCCSGSSRTGGKQTLVKNTSEECNRGEGVHKQQNPLPKALQRTDILWGCQERHQPLIREGLSGKVIEPRDRGDVQFLGPSGNLGTLKAMAPVHVVRDVRRLVKNTYNLSFKNVGDTVSGQEDRPPSFYQQSTYDQVSHREACGVRAARPDEKFVKKVSPPAPLKVVDTTLLYTAPKGFVTKATALHESQDIISNTGFTNVTPQSLVKPFGRRGSQPHINQSDSTSKYPNRAEMPRQTWSSVELPSKCNQRQCERTGTTNGKQKSPQAANSFNAVPTYNSSAAYQPEQYQCSSVKDNNQIQGPPPRYQAQTTLACTPSPACVQLNTTGTPQMLTSSFFCPANPMSCQEGKMSFIQAPVLMQPSIQNLPFQLLSEEKYAPRQPAGNGEIKMPSSDTQQQQYLCSTQGFMAPFSTEYRQSSAGLVYPEMAGGQVYGQGPRHMLMDPETGRCFYIDVPQLPPQPQRKMLFDPETCQYVEVLLPQRTVPTAVLPPVYAMPYHSLQFPAMCFSVQAHPQEMPRTGP